jgi:parallel beta helix pectate lyase-like protein
MKLFSAVCAFLVLAVLLAAPAAHAQATRTWVSGVGDDANPCSRTAPCKTFAGAISKTAAGGEISVLDPGGFGVVTITKAITINGDGTLAGILSAGTNGIIINAGANDRVVIRNVSINGVGTGLNGIRYLAGKSLTLDNVTISGVTGRGVDVSMTTAGNLFATNTRITNCGTGIFLNSSVFVLASLDNVALQNNTNGLEASANGRATISNSVISDNASNGLLCSSGSCQINAENNQIAFDALVGVNCMGNGGAIRLSNNHIYNNTTGISISAGCVVNSTGNNRVFANGGSTAPNGGAITQQ